MDEPPVRYVSDDDDSARWLGFPFRPGDIVISTRSKSGTTWVQMICALLVLRSPRLPVPLPELSPWLDWLAEPREQVLARLAELTGSASGPRPPRPPLREWPLSWIDRPADPRADPDSLPGVMWHLSDAWARRDRGEPVVLLHYDDLSGDLEGQMRA